MSEKRRDIRKQKRTPGESEANARARARAQAEQANRRKKERRILIFAAVGVLALALIVGVGVQLLRYNQAPKVAVVGADGFAPVVVTDAQPIVLGKPEAAGTLTVYSDFLCPHCQEFEEAMSPTIRKHLDAGDVKLETVPMSFIAADSFTLTNAYACAADQGVGMAYYSALFANTGLQWSNDKLVELGKQVRPDMPESFSTCVTRKQHQSWVDSMNAYAGEHGVDSTPAIFVNGDKLELNGLTAQALDEKLTAAAKR